MYHILYNNLYQSNGTSQEHFHDWLKSSELFV